MKLVLIGGSNEGEMLEDYGSELRVFERDAMKAWDMNAEGVAATVDMPVEIYYRQTIVFQYPDGIVRQKQIYVHSSIDNPVYMREKLAEFLLQKFIEMPDIE